MAGATDNVPVLPDEVEKGGKSCQKSSKMAKEVAKLRFLRLMTMTFLMTLTKVFSPMHFKFLKVETRYFLNTFFIISFVIDSIHFDSWLSTVLVKYSYYSICSYLTSFIT